MIEQLFPKREFIITLILVIGEILKCVVDAQVTTLLPDRPLVCCPDRSLYCPESYTICPTILNPWYNTTFIPLVYLYDDEGRYFQDPSTYFTFPQPIDGNGIPTAYCSPLGCDSNFPDSLLPQNYPGYSTGCDCVVRNVTEELFFLNTGSFINVSSITSSSEVVLVQTSIPFGRFGINNFVYGHDDWISYDTDESDYHPESRKAQSKIIVSQNVQCSVSIVSLYPKSNQFEVYLSQPPATDWSVIVQKEDFDFVSYCSGDLCVLTVPDIFFTTSGWLVFDVFTPMPNLCTTLYYFASGVIMCRPSKCTWSCPLQLYKYFHCLSIGEMSLMILGNIIVLPILLICFYYLCKLTHKLYCHFEHYPKHIHHGMTNVANSKAAEHSTGLFKGFFKYFGFYDPRTEKEIEFAKKYKKLEEEENKTKITSNPSNKRTGGGKMRMNNFLMVSLIVTLMSVETKAQEINCTVTCPSIFYNYYKEQPKAVQNLYVITLVCLILTVLTAVPFLWMYLNLFLIYVRNLFPLMYSTLVYSLCCVFSTDLNVKKWVVKTRERSSYAISKQTTIFTILFSCFLISMVFWIPIVSAQSFSVPDDYLCSRTISQSSTVGSCTTLDGNELCDVTFSLNMELNKGTTSCVELLDANGIKVAGIIAHYRELLAKVHLKKSYYTSAYTYKEESVFKCKNSNTVCPTGCDVFNTATTLSQVNAFTTLTKNNPGYQQCIRQNSVPTCDPIEHVFTGCCPAGDECLFYANGIYPYGDIYLVNEITGITYIPVIEFFLLDASISGYANNIIIEEGALSIDNYIFTVVGDYQEDPIIFGNNKAILNINNNSMFLHSASDQGTPIKGTIGDIQAQTISQLQSPSRTSFIFDKNIFSVSYSSKAGKAYAQPNGILQKINGISLPNLFNGQMFAYAENDLFANISRAATLTVNVQTTGTGFQAQILTSKVCPKILQVLNATGCWRCDMSSVVFVSLQSFCSSGFAYLSTDSDFITLDQSNVLLTTENPLIWPIRFRTSREDSSFTLKISDESGKYTNEAYVEFVAFEYSYNDSIYLGQDAPIEALYHKGVKGAVTPSGNVFNKLKNIWKTVVNGTGSWRDWIWVIMSVIISCVLLAVSLVVLKYVLVGAQIAWPKFVSMMPKRKPP